MGFFGSVVGPLGISNPTNDCPRHTPADSTRKLAIDFAIMTLLEKNSLGNFVLRAAELSNPARKRGDI
jgi:hypothetical protein